MKNRFAALADQMSELSNNTISLRLGLIASGLLIFQTGFSIWLQLESFWKPATVVLSTAAWILGISCFLLAMLTRMPRHAQWLILAGLLIALWGSAYIERLNFSPVTASRTDNEMIGEYSAEALRSGYNPYTWNFSDATRVYRDLGLRVTSFLDGSAQNRVTYPALPTLLLFALGGFGIGQARTISLIFHSILIILIFVGTPTRLRSFIALTLFMCRDLVIYTLSGLQDIVWSTLLVAMVLAWKRPTLRAILFGLACAYRQQPWILTPFLLIYLWNESAAGTLEERSGSPMLTNNKRQTLLPALTDPRVRGIIYFSIVSFSVFLLVNLPFMLWDFQAWTLGVFEPIYAAFNVYSQGLGMLTQYNILPLPREFYTTLQLSSLAIMLLIHWRHPREVGQAFWIFPGIFFWLYYRGLANYWLYWVPPLLVSIAHYPWNFPTRPVLNSHLQWTPTIIVVVVGLNILWGAYLIQHRPAVTANLIYPLETSNDRTVSRLGLTVYNNTDRVLHPRFSVQRFGTQPLVWEIEMGPEILDPRESAVYVISTSRDSRTFSVGRGAQVVINDALNDYGLRTVIDVPRESTFNNPDQIINPMFTFWSIFRRIPIGWSWRTSEAEVIQPQFVTMDGRSAVILTSEHGTGRLSQTVTFPDSLSIWIRPTATAFSSLQQAYGLELTDGHHQLWVLFGEQEGVEQVNPTFAVVYQRAPLNEWSRQTILPPELYTELGWELPEYSVRNRLGLEFTARQVMLSLLVSNMPGAQAFGAIEQDPGFASPRSLVDEAIANPDIYYVNMGDEYCRQRNVDLARQAYLRALEFNPDSQLASRGLETCQ